MKNVADISYKQGGVAMSDEAYEELRQFAITHGETDLPSVTTLKLSSPMKTNVIGVIHPEKKPVEQKSAD